MTATELERTTNYFVNEHSTNWPNRPNDWAELWVLIYMVDWTICLYHVTYAFQSESTLHIWLNVKRFFARKRHDIWCLSNWNGTQTHNHLGRRLTVNILAKLTKWLSWVVNTYLYNAFDCMLLSYHAGISEEIHALYLPEYQETLCFKEARYLKFKWLQRDSNAPTLSS